MMFIEGFALRQNRGVRSIKSYTRHALNVACFKFVIVKKAVSILLIVPAYNILSDA